MTTKNSELTKAERSVLFNTILETSGVASWGRATTLSNDLGVSQATASGWLSGSLPRDCASFLQCADKYDIDPYEWVSGTPRGKGLSVDKLERVIARLFRHEAESGTQSTPETAAKLIVMLYSDEAKAEYLLQNYQLLTSENHARPLT